MSEPRSAFAVSTALSLVCVGAVVTLLPAETAPWRLVVAGILSVGLGFQIATALRTPAEPKPARLRAWLDALAFPLVIAAMQLLPHVNGWVLLIAGVFWRMVVSAVLRAPSR